MAKQQFWNAKQVFDYSAKETNIINNQLKTLASKKKTIANEVQYWDLQHQLVIWKYLNDYTYSLLVSEMHNDRQFSIPNTSIKAPYFTMHVKAPLVTKGVIAKFLYHQIKNGKNIIQTNEDLK